MASLGRHCILATIFVTGAVVLVIEVAATRILAPYFGTTVYSVSSVLGVILAALGCGYYFGGRFADRYPEPRWFYGIIAAGGFALLLLRAAVRLALPIFGYFFSFIEGPLLWSMCLFFIPCFLLGTLSPYAVALRQRQYPQKGPGSVSGEVFFWSTAGSIAGSLLAGFVLIPHIPISSIITAMAALLLGIGFVGMGDPIRLMSKRGPLLLLLVAATALISTMEIRLTRPIYAKDGAYQRLAVYDGLRDGRPARFLQQDGTASGAMFIDSDEHVYAYTRYYAVYRLFAPTIQNALVIGGGTFTVPKALLRELPEAHVDVVEIEPDLKKIGRQFFRLPDDPRLAVHIADGRRFLHEDGRDYDLIFSDAYQSLIFVPPHLATKEFFEAGKRRLRANGLFVANIVGDPTDTGRSFLFSEMRTFRDVFPNSYFFTVQTPKPGAIRNVIFVGLNGETRFDISAEARRHADRFTRELPDHFFDTGTVDLSTHPPFTDDFAPVEYIAARGFLEPGRRTAPFRPEMTVRDAHTEPPSAPEIR